MTNRLKLHDKLDTSDRMLISDSRDELKLLLSHKSNLDPHMAEGIEHCINLLDLVLLIDKVGNPNA